MATINWPAFFWGQALAWAGLLWGQTPTRGRLWLPGSSATIVRLLPPPAPVRDRRSAGEAARGAGQLIPFRRRA